MDLTKHFTLAEFTRSATAQARGINNTPPDEIVPRLVATAEMLERIRTALGNAPITVTSGYRCPALNAAIGSRTSSDHTQGYAADFVAPAFGTPAQIAQHLATRIERLPIGQLILEQIGGKSWVHVSTERPKSAINRIITISDAGTVAGIVAVA
jgi:zinc D-Ala-D-Ala carboxypeptidase